MLESALTATRAQMSNRSCVLLHPSLANILKWPDRLTRSSTHLSRSRRSLNTHSRPEEVMQNVEEACLPRPHTTSLKKLFLSSPRSPERPSRGTVEFTCTHRPIGMNNGHGPLTDSWRGRGRLGDLGGLCVIQVPELDVSVTSGDKVGAVVREGDGRHLTGDLVGGNQDVFLRDKQTLLPRRESNSAPAPLWANRTRAGRQEEPCQPSSSTR